MHNEILTRYTTPEFCDIYNLPELDLGTEVMYVLYGPCYACFVVLVDPNDFVDEQAFVRTIMKFGKRTDLESLESLTTAEPPKKAETPTFYSYLVQYDWEHPKVRIVKAGATLSDDGFNWACVGGFKDHVTAYEFSFGLLQTAFRSNSDNRANFGVWLDGRIQRINGD